MLSPEIRDKRVLHFQTLNIVLSVGRVWFVWWVSWIEGHWQVLSVQTCTVSYRTTKLVVCITSEIQVFQVMCDGKFGWPSRSLMRVWHCKRRVRIFM